MNSNLTPWARVATVWPLGIIPFAPGTWGSIPGLLLAAAIALFSQFLEGISGISLYAWITLILIGLSFLSEKIIRRAEHDLGNHDDKRIVIDEVIGQAIAVAFFPIGWTNYLVGFILFRFFDILKPGPINFFDKKVKSAWGTLLDDVIAGIFSGACLYLISQYLL